MDLLENGDIVTLVAFSICQFADVGCYNPNIRVTTGVNVDKAGKKTYHLDGNRYPQGQYGTALEVGHSRLARKIVVPYGHSTDEAVAKAKDLMKASVTRAKTTLSDKLEKAVTLEKTIADKFKVREVEWD